MSRSGLVEHFGVSPSLITRITRGLIDDGILSELAPQASAVGRPPTLLEVSPDYGTLVAAACTASGVHARSTDLHGRTLGEVRTPATGGTVPPELILRTVADLAARTPRLLGVGIGIAGVVDAGSGEVSAAPNLGWQDRVPLHQIFADRLQPSVTVTLDNDVNLMMLAEHEVLAPRQRRDAVYIYLGDRGIGAGVIAGGQLITGAHGAAGEVGIAPLGTGGGTAPALEDRASAHTITSRWTSDMPTGPALADLLEHAAVGDARARTIRDELITNLAHSITHITAVVDPGVIVLGGHARAFGAAECSQVMQALDERLPYRPQIVRATLGADAVLDAARARCWNQILAGGL